VPTRGGGSRHSPRSARDAGGWPIKSLESEEGWAGTKGVVVWRGLTPRGLRDSQVGYLVSCQVVERAKYHEPTRLRVPLRADRLWRLRRRPLIPRSGIDGGVM